MGNDAIGNPTSVSIPLKTAACDAFVGKAKPLLGGDSLICCLNELRIYRKRLRQYRHGPVFISYTEQFRTGLTPGTGTQYVGLL